MRSGLYPKRFVGFTNRKYLKDYWYNNLFYQTANRRLCSVRSNYNPLGNISAIFSRNRLGSVHATNTIDINIKHRIQPFSVATDRKEKKRYFKLYSAEFSSLSSDKIFISSSGNQWSMEKIGQTVTKLKECPPGNLTEIMLREASQAIASLAHLIDKKDNTSLLKYNIGLWSRDILNRLTEEEDYLNTLCDENKSKKPQLLNTQLYHLAIKCMIKSTDSSLIMKADEILIMLERKFLKNPKSSTAQPVLRSYTTLFDFLRYSNREEDCLNISEKVQSLIQRIEKQENAGNIHMILNTVCFNAALNALVSFNSSKDRDYTMNTAQMAISLLNLVIESQRFQIDSVTFSTALKLLAKIVTVTKYNDRQKANSMSFAVENILQKFDDLGHKPSSIIMTPILNAFAKNGDTKRASNLLEWMQEMHREYGWNDLRPNRIHFNTLIDGFANSGQKNSGKHAMEILRNMEQLYLAGENEDVKPDLTTYNSVLNAISKDGNVPGQEEPVNNAEILLQEMEEGSNGRISPDVISYNSVLSAWMYSNLPTATDNIEKLIQKMKRRGIQPDLLSYSICINSYANCKTYKSAQRSEDILRMMKENYHSGLSSTRPDIKCYNGVLRAWASCGRLHLVRKTLEEMKELSRNRIQSELEPNLESYTILVNALANSSERNSAQAAQKILDDLIQKSINENSFELIDTALFNAVINAWAKSGEDDASEKVEAILVQMEELSSSQTEGMWNICPNTITFNSVLNTLSKSRKKGSSTKAEAILSHMQDLHESGNLNVKPDTLSFSSVLNAHAKSGEHGAGEKAEKILKHMFAISENDDSVTPNTICFSTVINAHAKSRGKNSAQKAENVLRWMQKISAEGNINVKPNTISFTSVADAWSKSGRQDAVEKTYNVIKWMEELHKSGNSDVKPNTFTYNCLINAIARSHNSNKPQRALAILRKMQIEFDMGHTELEPNIYSFNAVILACAFVKGDKKDRFDALKLCIEIFEEAMVNTKNNDLTNITYGSFFQACGYLTKNDHERQRIENIVETVFRQCCLDGQVDNKLIRQVHLACSQSLLQRLFSEFVISPGHITIQDVPRSWSKNVKKRKF